MRAAWARFQNRVPDLSSLGEQAMVERMWPGLEQPVTAAPTVTRTAGRIALASPTQGASVGYRINGGPWQLYTAPVQVPAGSTLEAKAVRYGYAESEIVRQRDEQVSQVRRRIKHEHLRPRTRLGTAIQLNDRTLCFASACPT